MISDAQLLESRHVRGFLARLPNHDLHKIAGVMHGVDEVDLYSALQLIGTKLAHDLMKQDAITRGLASYDVVTKNAGFRDAIEGIRKKMQPHLIAAEMGHLHRPPVTPDITHIIGNKGFAQGVPEGVADAYKDLGLGGKMQSIPVPDYVNQAKVRELPNVPLGMDRMHPEVGTAAGTVGKKAKPTMEMGAQEMPAMFRMGEGAVAPGGRMSSSTAPQMAAGSGAPGKFPATFQGVPGAGAGAEAGQGPAMFNLKDLMGKQASDFAALRTYLIEKYAFDRAAVGSQLLDNAAVPAIMGLGIGAGNAAAAPEGMGLEAFARPAANIALGGAGGAMAGRALADRIAPGMGRAGAIFGGGLGMVGMGTATREAFPYSPEYEAFLSQGLDKEAAINLQELLHAAPKPQAWRNPAAMMPSHAPTPKLQGAMQGAVAPSPFGQSPMRAVPSPEEIAEFAARSKTAVSRDWIKNMVQQGSKEVPKARIQAFADKMDVPLDLANPMKGSKRRHAQNIADSLASSKRANDASAFRAMPMPQTAMPQQGPTMSQAPMSHSPFSGASMPKMGNEDPAYARMRQFAAQTGGKLTELPHPMKQEDAYAYLRSKGVGSAPMRPTAAAKMAFVGNTSMGQSVASSDMARKAQIGQGAQATTQGLGNLVGPTAGNVLGGGAKILSGMMGAGHT